MSGGFARAVRRVGRSLAGGAGSGEVQAGERRVVGGPGTGYPSSLVGEHVRKHAQLRGALRALHAYLSRVPSLLDGGSVLVSIADGSCGEGSSDNPANDRDRGREHQRARTRFTLAGFRRIAGMQRSLPRRGAATHHACPAWYPFRAPTSRRSGAGGQEFD